MSAPVKGWSGVHRGLGGSEDPHGSALQGPLSALPVLIDSARPPRLAAPGGQSPSHSKQQPLVPGALTWGAGSKWGTEEGPQEEDRGVLAAQLIPEPGRDGQTGLLLQPPALSSPPPKVPVFPQLRLLLMLSTASGKKFLQASPAGPSFLSVGNASGLRSSISVHPSPVAGSSMISTSFFDFTKGPPALSWQGTFHVTEGLQDLPDTPLTPPNTARCCPAGGGVMGCYPHLTAHSSRSTGRALRVTGGFPDRGSPCALQMH